MAFMRRSKIRYARARDRVVDTGGKAWYVLEDDFPGPVPVSWGTVRYVCDSSGRVAMIPGHVEATFITPDSFEDLGFMLRNWQCDVN